MGASTMPEVEGVVDGVGTESKGTELVVGYEAAVGEVLSGLPLTLLAGCGMLGGPEGCCCCAGACACCGMT